MNNDNAKQFVEKYFDEFKKSFAGDCNADDAYMLNACASMYRATKEQRYKDVVLDYLSDRVSEDGSIKGFVDGRLSYLSIGVAIIFAYDMTGEEKYKNAAVKLFGKLNEMPRCNSVFVYDRNKIDDVSVASFYEGITFYMLYETRFGGKEHYNDVIVQFRQARKLIFDQVKGIYHSGIENGKQLAFDISSEADMIMSIIDALSYIDQPIYEYYNELKDLFKEAIHGLLPYQKKDNLFFVDGIVAPVKNSQGCFNCTAKVLYSILKGCRMKAILAEKYDETAEKTFASLVSYAPAEMADGLKAKPFAAFMLAYSEYIMR